MAPLTRFGCSVQGNPTSELADYYVRRADNDAGLIIVESCAINSSDAMGYRNGAQFHSQIHADAWSKIVDQVHSCGAKIWVQLFHSGRLTVPEISNGIPLAPSSIKPGDYPSYWRPKVNGAIVNFQTLTPYVSPKEMSLDDIENVIADFENAVSLAESCGFDGVEIHGAHGYLVHSFLSRISNARSDIYGLTNGHKFLETLVRRCRAILTKSTVLSFRCSVHMVDNPLIRFSSDETEFHHIIPLLDKAGIDVFHSSEIDANKPLFGSKQTLHQIIRSNTSKPIIICGSIRSLEEANDLIKSDNNILIAFGRNFISNPNLVRLLKDGQQDKIVKFEYNKHLNVIF
jgi:2,4-dienoyl-CoA reductase-like NADH-dependent reductase (Old Yellow Enzyme family)